MDIRRSDRSQYDVQRLRLAVMDFAFPPTFWQLMLKPCVNRQNIGDLRLKIPQLVALPRIIANLETLFGLQRTYVCVSLNPPSGSATEPCARQHRG